MSEERTESPGVSLANEMYAEPEAVVEIVSDSEEVETEEAHTETTTESNFMSRRLGYGDDDIPHRLVLWGCEIDSSD